MSAVIDPLDSYVRERLDEWGHEFAYYRNRVSLETNGKNILQVLIEHKGEMPARQVGVRPLTIPPMPLEIECIISRMATHNLRRAIVLRAYYCGSGRRGVERLEDAQRMLSARGMGDISRKGYFDEHRLGVLDVALALESAE